MFMIMNRFKTISCADFSLLFNGQNTLQAKVGLGKCYSDCVLSRQFVEQWFAGFKPCGTNNCAAKCSGHPKRVVIPKKLKSAQDCVGKS